VGDLHLSQDDVVEHLRDFQALAKYAKAPVHISLNPLRDEMSESRKEWLAVRKPVPRPHPTPAMWSGWSPSRPARCHPTVTLDAKDLNLREALSILCGMAGLEWKIDKWMGVRITFVKEKANKTLDATSQ